ncbi:MAG: YbjQ family protein, partial [Actinomycetota bacterium]
RPTHEPGATRCVMQMSDTAQGPDWWQASDGKWYPPQPAAPAPQQPQPAPAAQQPAHPPQPQLTVVNTETVPGHEIVELKGLVQGNTIRAKNIGRDIGASFKSMVGGELMAYTELLSEARAEAVNRMVAHAGSLGANAIVNVRFTTSAIAGGAAELYAYGTAVVVRRASAP